MKHLFRILVAAVMVAWLSACGGGGTSTSTPVAATAPTIVTAPSAVSVGGGQTATFTVVAAGSGTLSYQWRRNGVDIPGATSASYTTPVLAQGDTGSYTVRVSNAVGSVISGAAALSVGAPGSGFSDTPAAATDLANEAKAAIAAAESKALAPGGIELIGALPTGVTTTVNCGASGSYTYDAPANFAAGTTYSFTYNNCSFGGGYVFNGSYVITYTAFSVNPYAFAWTIQYNLSYTGPNNFNYSYAGTQSCTYDSNSDYSCTYNDGSRTFQSNFTYSAGTINGSYVWAYGSYGSATYTFNNWTATSGSITVTGPNGFTATIVRTSATTFVVTINGGSPRTITL
jgi:Immunoglobulin I-set domain